MVSIDVFTHVLPRSYRRAAERTIPNLGERYPFLRQSLLADMDMRLVANPPRSLQIIALPIVSEAEETMGTHALESANNELAQTVLDHPELFIGAIARLSAKAKDRAWSAHYVSDTIGRSDSIVGVQMLTRENDLPLADPSLEPLFDAIDASRRPVFVHPLAHARDMAGCRDQWKKDLEQMLKDLASSNVLTGHPHLLLVLHGGALLGGTALASLLDAIPGSQRIAVDTALASSRQIAEAAKALGAGRVLFSSEAPFAADGQDPLDAEFTAMKAVRDAGLSDQEADAILGGTIQSIRRHLPVNVKSEADAYKEDRAAQKAKQAAEDEKRARELDEQDDKAQAALDAQKAKEAAAQAKAFQPKGQPDDSTHPADR